MPTAKPAPESRPLVVEMRKLSELKPDPANPRNNTSAIEMIAASIRDFGFKVPLVVDANGKIVAGHARYLAASMLKLETVPVVVADDLDESQLRGFSIAENRTSDFSFFDIAKLAELADDIDEQYVAEFDLDGLLEGLELESVQIDSEPTPTKREGLDLAPFEKYQYVTIICRNTYDYTNLLARLGLEDVQARYVGKYLKRGHAIGRIIEYPEFVQRLDGQQP